ncbi:MAG: ADP-ribosylglycohydrolase family protein [Caldilineaceae bacterium]
MRIISYAEYYDKVYGGWIGKCIGGNIGAEVENNKYLMDLHENEIFPDQIPPNDDLDLQLLWLQVLERKGIHLTSRDLAEAWQQYCWYPFNEYGYFLHNFERKIDPPVSGWYNNQFFCQSMGSPIRSEIWGMIAVGNPGLAMRYAYLDATLDHNTESVWGEQMLAAIEAEAFFEADFDHLLDFGLAQIPLKSGLYQCIEFVRSEYSAGTPWQEARARLLLRFGDPDASKAVQNLGFTILALLYGERDFGRTQLIALNCGYDTDCTCATAGAILGIIGGAGAIPEEWKWQAEDTFVVGIDVQRPSDRISDLATDTCRVGVAVAQAINRDTKFVDVPPDLSTQRIPVSAPEQPVTVTVDYCGKPALDPPAPKKLILQVRNESDVRRQGRLDLSALGCDVSPSGVDLILGERAEQSVGVTVEVAPQTTEYATATSLCVRWQEPGLAATSTEFGLALGQPYYVVGPFWDLYDTRVEGAESFWDPVKRRKARPRGAENFNNYVNLDRAYITEGSFAQLPSNGRVVFADEHKLPIDEWIGTAGPACLYLFQDVVSPDERTVRLMIGNSDAFRVWVNDEQVVESRDPWYWMPYNHDITVVLRPGPNRIVTKVVRRGRTCDFSLGFAVPKTHVRWINDLVRIIPA